MSDEAACIGHMEIFGAGVSYGDPEQAKPICAECPISSSDCIGRFVRLHGTRHGVLNDLTLGGLSGPELRREIDRRLNRRAAA